tara:strand:- start:384 stop:545 length:162 start_codon:yes stop_codon:yes gene_type:complete
MDLFIFVATVMFFIWLCMMIAPIAFGLIIGAIALIILAVKWVFDAIVNMLNLN